MKFREIKLRYYVYLSIALLFGYICLRYIYSDQPLAQELSLENKKVIIETFRNHSIFKRGELVILVHHKGELKNKYFFRQINYQDDNHFSLLFLRDSLEFEPLSHINSSNLRNSNDFKKEIEEYAMGLVTKMDSLEIAEVSSEFAKFGIDLKIYLKDKSVLIFVSQHNKIKKRDWISYIDRANKLDPNWYYFDPGQGY